VNLVAELTVSDNEGKTALTMVAEKGLVISVQLLLENAADFCRSLREGKT
jgi:hypothetical protein